VCVVFFSLRVFPHLLHEKKKTGSFFFIFSSHFISFFLEVLFVVVVSLGTLF
jgi:hypothetical protein